MDDDVAIRISGVSKDFRLPNEKESSLKGRIVHPFRRRTFSQQHALRNIDLEIKKGEFFGIVGRNGSGKSTLLKIIAGIYQPTKGKIQTAGRLVPFIELGVGFNPELSGRDNIYLNGALLGFSQKEIDSQYQDIVNFAELEPFMDQKLKNYSSGMQVRLAFSMAIRAQADILLIDEVLAVGDADFQRKCFDYFKQVKRQDITVVFVSHNMDAVREYCDRAMLIEDSKVADVGTTTKISERYTRMFITNQKAEQQAEDNYDRWGDGTVKINKVDVDITAKNITLSLLLQSNSQIDNPIAGFRLRDAAGKYVTGTNTKIEHKDIGQLKSGAKLTVSWQFPNVLSDGEYIVDPSVIYSDGITVCDWWNEAAAFKIKKNRHLPYVLDPGFITAIT